MNTVKVYQPTFRVTLYKMVARKGLGGKAVTSDRFQGTVQQQAVDLTPFLGDGAAVRTNKSVRQPAGGFQLTIGDQAHGAAMLETLYGLIEPMDMIEIRGRHALTGTGDVPVIMRGFVSDISRSEAMSGDGRPQRVVTINGQDYGKIWQIMQIVFWADYVLGQDFISGFRLFEKFGVGFATALPVQDFVGQVFDKCINPFVDKMMPADFPLPREIKTDITVRHGTTSPGIQSQQGTFYNLLAGFSDVGVWNEMFIEDRDDGVFVVFRPNPYLTATDDPPQKIQTDAPDPVYIDIGDDDLVSISVSRSDANVSNYFWVAAPRFDLVDDYITRQWAVTKGSKDTVVLAEYTNSQERLYGTRVMQAETSLGADSLITHNTGGPKDAVTQQGQTMVEWVTDRRKTLVEQNKDNILFERGSMRVRGNEAIKAGTYVRLSRGSTSAVYYVVEVDHEIVPYSGWFTTVQFERGTGFIRRIQAGGSPYLAEMS